uniref:NP-Den-13 n=1 Tax=Denisonia devisi TaxID=529689 RepID=R4G2T0_DENDV
MLGLSRLAGGGLLLLVLALLPLALDGKPAPLPEALPTAPAGGMKASRPVLTEQQKQQNQQQNQHQHPLPPMEESSGPAAERSGSETAKIGDGCFGVPIDHIGSSSGMGCGGVPKPGGS